MKKSKKEIIISHARKTFNKEGFAAVSLYELAQSMGMTRGNLTYHFKTKSELLKAIAEEMWSKIEVERNRSLQYPSFKNLHHEIQIYYKFQKEYAFIFLDHHVLNHPTIKKQFRELTNRSIADNKQMIAFAIRNGTMQEEKIKGTYHQIAFVTWMISFFWLSQQIIRGEKTKVDGEKTIWSLLLPHMTDKGVELFKSFFGTEYYENIGESFEVESFASF